MYSLGIDVGSVSTDMVLTDENRKIVRELYLKTGGDPIKAVKEGLSILGREYGEEEILATGTTGSGRRLAAAMAGADIVKNEITSHAAAALAVNPQVRTVIEIGGQDSKIILLRDGHVADFAMNTVCAAGTGSFLDRQAERLGLGVEHLGDYAMRARNPIRVAGRCAVFAESDLIHKQQVGCSKEDIIAGMCQSLARNYLSNVGKGKKIEEPVMFQGGVSENQGMKAAFEKELGMPVQVPEYNKVMGAYGISIMALERAEKRKQKKSSFRGFETAGLDFKTVSFCCNDCANNCEVVKLMAEGRQLGAFSDRCGKYQELQAT